MHISEGILATPLLGGAWAAAAAGLVYGMRRTQPEDMPRVALCSAAFFVVTFVRIPLGPAHLHLAATGLVGILLGWRAFPALLVALLLQAVLFQFGGLAVLGANTVVMALPAVGAYYLYRRWSRSADPRRIAVAAGAVGALAITGNVLIMAAFLLLTDRAFAVPALGVLLFHVPLMLVEGVVTALAVAFLFKVRRDLLPNPEGPP